MQTKCKGKNEKVFPRAKVMPNLNFATILTRTRHFESANKLFSMICGLPNA
jgi:hypothetical protein